MLPEFNMLTPRTLSQALDMLAAGGSEIAPLAGGTNLLVDMRGGRHRPNTLMDLGKLDELRSIQLDDDCVVVGGCAAIAELVSNPLIAQHGPSLRDAAAMLGNPLIRNRATIAGNLVDGSPAADTVPPLLALDAEVELASQSGTRRVPLDEFLVGVRQTLRRPDELLTFIRWSIPPPRSSSAFYKIGLRKADAIAVVSVGVMVSLDEDGHCERARIALGSVAPRVIRARAAEDTLRGQAMTDDLIAEAARLAAEATSPIDDLRGSADYRRRTAEALVRRLIGQLRAGFLEWADFCIQPGR